MSFTTSNSISSNDSLGNVSGIGNLTSIGGSIFIFDNVSLSSCDVQSICNYLAAPNGTIEIHGNAPGCNSSDEVLYACNVSLQDLLLEEGILIFPNPADKTITISTQNGKILKDVNIYTLTGKRVQHGKPVNNSQDISRLKPGMYIIELISNQWKVREKLIVE